MVGKIGRAVRTIREKQNITQTELARMTGKSRSYICDIEHDRYRPSLNTLRDIARSLQVSLSHIFLLAEHGEAVQNKDEVHHRGG